jgi:hypothetical protein
VADGGAGISPAVCNAPLLNCAEAGSSRSSAKAAAARLNVLKSFAQVAAEEGVKFRNTHPGLLMFLTGLGARKSHSETTTYQDLA